MRVGDVVLIYNDNSRVNWKLVFVIFINRGCDGFVYFVNLFIVNGIINRFIRRLYFLEV